MGIIRDDRLGDGVLHVALDVAAHIAGTELGREGFFGDEGGGGICFAGSWLF